MKPRAREMLRRILVLGSVRCERRELLGACWRGRRDFLEVVVGNVYGGERYDVGRWTMGCLISAQ